MAPGFLGFARKDFCPPCYPLRDAYTFPPPPLPMTGSSSLLPFLSTDPASPPFVSISSLFPYTPASRPPRSFPCPACLSALSPWAVNPSSDVNKCFVFPNGPLQSHLTELRVWLLSDLCLSFPRGPLVAKQDVYECSFADMNEQIIINN